MLVMFNQHHCDCVIKNALFIISCDHTWVIWLVRVGGYTPYRNIPKTGIKSLCASLKKIIPCMHDVMFMIINKKNNDRYAHLVHFVWHIVLSHGLWHPGVEVDNWYKMYVWPNWHTTLRTMTQISEQRGISVFMSNFSLCLG